MGWYDEEVRMVQSAIEALRTEGKPCLMQYLEQEQAAAATGLEYYGITRMVLKQFLREQELTKPTRAALKKAINAVKKMYTK